MRHWLLLLAGVSCSSSSSSPASSGAADAAAAASSNPIVDAPGGDAGTGTALPAGVASKLLVGLFEDGGQTWMKDSGVPWNARYRYLVKGWANNFGYGDRDGSFAGGYFDECAKQGAVPAVAYYQMNGETGGSEGSFLAKAQNATTMASYFDDFKLLMQRAKDFGKPVFILLEADGYAFIEQQAKDDPSTAAAVASTNMPELAGLPNTVAGWGLAFLAIRRSVGASNAILGMHISAWASGKDISYYNVTDPLEPEVTKVETFLNPLGLAANVTGQTYDVLVGDPLDRDSDFYRLVNNDPNRWWDADDAAPIGSRSFNRYAEWMRLWNVATSKPWVLWQIPLGNSNHQNVNNAGAPGQGYKDNRPEYFFGPGGTAHLQKFAASGAIALLFGAGTGGQSSYQNDTYTDNQLFMKSHVGAFFESGGLTLPNSR